MLEPEYLTHITEGAEEIAEMLHQDIIKRIISRMMNRIARGSDYLLTATDKWNLEVLQDSGYLLEDIQKEIAKYTKLQQQEIKEAMEDAGVKTLAYDDAVYKAAGLSPMSLMQSPYLIRVMQRNYEATLGQWKNFTRTTAIETQQTFIKACDKAYHLTASGAASYTQAVREAVNEIAGNGVIVKYSSGHRDTIETATLRCVRTGISQMSGQITDARMKEMDWDIILVSSHLGARVTGNQDFTDHSWWQGKFYSRTGKDKRFPLFSICGMGNVQGIHGANCRHSHGPGDGEHNPFEQYDSEENKKRYELEQQQRALERRIRKTKREVMAWKEAIDKAQDEKVSFENNLIYQKKIALLQKQNKEYNDFCKKNNLKKLNDRIQIARWDRQRATAAKGATERYSTLKQNYKNKQIEFLIKKHNPNVNILKEQMNVMKAISSVPLKVQNAINNGTIINIGRIGASAYDYDNDIMYIAKNAGVTDAIHEIGHLFEKKIIDAQVVQQLRKKIVANVTELDIVREIYYDANKKPVEIFVLKNNQFVSEYQGRVYCNTIEEAFDENNNFKDELLKEFVAEPFREYIENPDALRKNHKEFYDMIEEALK